MNPRTPLITVALLAAAAVPVAEGMTWVMDPFLTDSFLGKLSQHGVRSGMEDAGFTIVEGAEGDHPELIVGRRGDETVEYRFEGDQTVTIDYSDPLEPDENAEELIYAWAGRFAEFYYDSEPTVTNDGALMWDNSYGRFSLRLDDGATGRTIRIHIDWPEP